MCSSAMRERKKRESTDGVRGKVLGKDCERNRGATKERVKKEVTDLQVRAAP